MSADSQRSSQDRLTILQFNLWGNMGFAGSNEIAHAAAASIRERLPQVVTLNEVCEHQAEAIKDDLDAWGLDYHFHHDTALRIKTKTDIPCAFGNALFWKGGAYEQRQPEIALVVPKGQQPRKLLAVRVATLGRPTMLCVTHLISGWGPKVVSWRKGQVAQVAEYVESCRTKGNEVIVGGDFNCQPDRSLLDPMYLPEYGGGSNGLCHEASARRKRPFEPTTDAGYKFDYIFMTDGYAPLGSQVTHSASDHHLYCGFAAFA